MTDPPPSPHRRSSNRRNSMLPSNNSLIGSSESPTMVDWFSSAGALSSLSREEQDVLNSTCGGRRLSDISLNRLSNLVARRLSGCDNGISNDYACGSGMNMQNMMGVASLERLISERRMPSLTMQDDIPSDFKLTAIENARRRRRSSMSQQSQGDFSEMSHFSRRKSIELAALEKIARRRRSSMSQQSDLSITTQHQFQRECLELAAIEKATRSNSLDLLGDVAALASSNSSMSTGAVPTNNVNGVGDILKNLTSSGSSPNRSSLDILSEASIALSVKNAHDNKILAQSLIGLSNKRQRFPYEQDETNQLFDDALPPATFPELGIDQCPPFGILQPTRTKGTQQQIQQQAQQQMKQPAQYHLKQRQQIQAQQQMQQQAQQEMKLQAQQEMKLQAQQEMKQQAQQEMKQQAQQQIQLQAQQEMTQQAQQQIQQQAQLQMQQQAQQEMKQQAQQQMQHQNQRKMQHQDQQQMHQAQHQMQHQAQQQMQQQNQRQMRHQAQQEMKQQAQEHRQRQTQQRLQQQAQQQMLRQTHNNALSSQAIQRNMNNPMKPFSELSRMQSNSVNYSQLRQSAPFLYGPQENQSGNCKATNINTKIMPPPKESLTAQRLPIPLSPTVLNNSEPLIKDFSKSIQNSQKSQKNIQSWDKKMGLKRSHSATMTKTTQSRNQIKKFLESMSERFQGCELSKVGRSSRKKRKSDMGYLGGGFY